MNYYPQRSFFFDLIRPIFQFFISRKKGFIQKIRSHFHDPYLCGMVSQFNRLHELIFKPYFEKVRVDRVELDNLKRWSQEGTLVYVMKNQGQLEYSFFNHLFLKEGIPLARFANGCQTLFWRPFKEIVLLLLGRLDHYYEKGSLKEPLKSGVLEKHILAGENVLLNLKVSREFVFKASEDPVNFIPALIRAAKTSVKPVYLITQQYIYDRRPEKSQKSLLDLLFGEKSSPGSFRKLILFAMSYRRRTTIKFGEPLELAQFVRENKDVASDQLANNLKEILLTRLSIEQKSITGPALKPREWFLDKILADPAFKKKIEKIKTDESLRDEAINRDVSRIFYEIAAQINYSFIEFYNGLIRWLTQNIYDGLDVDLNGLSRIKSIAGKYPVVLVPSHKSHIDYLLISYLFYNYDLTLPHVCAGLNLRFWPVGLFVRKGGGFFIRRSIRGNPLYKLVLEHYLKALVSEGYSIEFFIEGTRSRTGKLLKPRTGILSMLIQNYLEGAAADIYFVPISINYERIIEEKSYTKEIQGEEKEKENVAGLIKAGKKFKRKYGRVSVQFAEPLSLKAFMEEKNLLPGEGTVDTHREEIGAFASRITYNINKVSSVTSTSLVATAALSYYRKGIPEHEITQRAHLLYSYLKYKEAPLSAVLNQNELWAYREAIQKLTDERVLTSHRDFVEKFYTLGDAQRVGLDYHKNNVIHFFVSLVVFSKIISIFLSKQPDQQGESALLVLPLSEIEKKYEALKSLLIHDFTFSERATLTEHLLRVVRYYELQELLAFSEDQKTISLKQGIRNNFSFCFFNSLLNNFFETYWLTLLYIRHISFEKMEKKHLIRSVLEKGRVLYHKGDILHPEALSRFTVENALLAFEDMGLVKRDPQGLISRAYDIDTIHKWEEILQILKKEVEGGNRSLKPEAEFQRIPGESEKREPTSTGLH